MFRVFLLVLAISALVAAADSTDGVREAALGWRQGAIHQDRAALERFLSDDLVYTHGGGKRQGKAEYIAEVTKGPAHYESFTGRGEDIRLFGKVAVLWGVVDVKPAKGEAYRVRTLEVYVENDGRWQLAQKESVRISSDRSGAR